MGQQRVFLTVQSIQIRKISRSRLKAKERTKLNFGQTMTELVCPKNKEVRQFFERLYNSHRKGVFSLFHNKKVQAVIMTRTKVWARIKKGKADFQLMKIWSKRDKFIPRNHSIGIPIILMIPSSACRGTTAYNSRHFAW